MCVCVLPMPVDATVRNYITLVHEVNDRTSGGQKSSGNAVKRIRLPCRAVVSFLGHMSGLSDWRSISRNSAPPPLSLRPPVQQSSRSEGRSVGYAVI